MLADAFGFLCSGIEANVARGEEKLIHPAVSDAFAAPRVRSMAGRFVRRKRSSMQCLWRIRAL